MKVWQGERSFMKAIVTGSCGLIGSECARILCAQGWSVHGIDNNMRAWFFGPQGSTAAVVRDLHQEFSRYSHHDADIRDRQKMKEIVQTVRPDLIVHTAAQPSHDLAAKIPYEDFDTNAGGTLNMLAAAREYCPESPFCFTSTNKVYGDRPNSLPLAELDTRFDYVDGDMAEGIDESMGVDQCLHSLFGASKLAADVLCQEYGRYFSMPVGIFRGGCLTGPLHAAVELHGYLAYIVHCAAHELPYVIYGYKGKQVRDQIHTNDVVSAFLEFFKAPRCGEVYNLGGGRQNSISILETIAYLRQAGFPLRYEYKDEPRRGDHICYISNMNKFRSHFPAWRLRHSMGSILEEMVRHHREGKTHRAAGATH